MAGGVEWRATDADVSRVAVVVYESVWGGVNSRPDVGDAIDGLIDHINTAVCKIQMIEMVLHTKDVLH